MSLMKTHFSYGGAFQTVCGRHGIWTNTTLNPEEVTCLSCARIEGIDVKARIAKEYRKARQDSWLDPDSLKIKRIISYMRGRI